MEAIEVTSPELLTGLERLIDEGNISRKDELWVSDVEISVLDWAPEENLEVDDPSVTKGGVHEIVADTLVGKGRLDMIPVPDEIELELLLNGCGALDE